MPRSTAHYRPISYLNACRILLPAALGARAFPGSAAATHTWNAVNGNWSTASNWSPATLPGANENIFLTASDGVSRTITFDNSVPLITFGVLDVDLTGAGTNVETLSIVSGNLNTSNEKIGEVGRGAVIHSGGNNTIANALSIGDTFGAVGSYTLSAGELSVGGNEIVGNNGTGVLTVGDLDIVAGNIILGAAASGNGTFSIISGGTASAANLSIGSSAGGKGIFNISSGGLQTPGNVTIANTVGSALNISGGIFTASGIQNSNAAGAVQFTGGQLHLTFQQVDFAANATADPSALLLPNTFTFNPGQVLNDQTWVWLRSSGTTVTQVPLSQISTSEFYIGNQTGAGANAVYNLNGGFLTVSDIEFIGYIGTGGVGGGGATINQTAGSNSAAHMILGRNGPATYNQSNGNVALTTDLQIAQPSAAGTYNLSGGLLTVPTAFVGGSISSGGGSGVLNISGTGNMNVSGAITVYNTAGTSLTLSGGSLTTGTLNFSGNTALIHWTGGSLHLTGQPLDITNVADANAPFGNSLSLGFGQSLTVDQSENLTGSGASINQSGGFNSAPTLITGNSSGAGPAASYTMTAGILNVGGILGIGDNGPSTFSQSGGSVTCNQIVSGNSTGNFTLSGTAVFTVFANELFAGNGGVVTQSGGTNNIGSTLVLPYALGGNAIYNFSGGTITGTDSVSIGGSVNGPDEGPGIFNMSGSSTLTIPGTLSIHTPLANDFNFNGGTLSVGGLSLNGNPGNFNWTAGTLKINAPSVTWDPNAASNGTGSAFGNALNLGTGKTLVINGNETLGGSGGFALAVNSGGTHTVSGTLTLSGNGAIALNGGTLNVSGLNLAANPAKFIWNTGTLSINSDVTWDASIPPTSTGGAFGSALALATSTTLAITGNETIGANGPFTLTLNSGATHTVTGNITLNSGGALVNNGAQFSYNTLIQNGGTISGSANNTLNNFGTFIYNSGSFNGQFVNEGTADVNVNGFFSPTNGIQNDGLMIVSSTSTVLISNGFLFNTNTVQLAGGAVEFNTGAVYNAVGTFTDYGSIYAFNGLNSFAHIIQGNGTLSFGTSSLPFTNSGVIDLAPNQNVNIFTFNFTNSGLINLNGGALGPYGMLNAATGVITGNGTIYGNNSFTNAGLLEVDTGMLTIFGNPFTNTGTVQLGGISTILNSAITNSGTIQGLGRVTGAVTSNGTIEAIGGTLSFANSLASTGTLRTAAGTKLLVQNFPTNAGLIDLAGGTFDTAGQSLNNTGQITGFGVLSTGGLTNNGTLTLTGGTATVNGPVINPIGHTIIAKNQPAIFTGNITNNGIIKITNTTVTFTGNYTGNQYISDPATNIFQANATVTPGGLMTGGPGDVFIFNTFTNNGTFTNGGNLSVSTSITNTATFTQSGPQSWLPGATFTNTSGTATFASNAKLFGIAITAGTVDITTSKFIIEPANKSATLAAIQSNIATHALIASGTPANYGLALLDNALLNKPTFGGNLADANSLLLSIELLGDANVDGVVNAADLNIILTNFGTATPAWTSGNFDHASTIDLSDLADVLNNFGQTNPNPTTSSALPAPEPASLTILAGATFARLIRRRTRRS